MNTERISTGQEKIDGDRVEEDIEKDIDTMSSIFSQREIDTYKATALGILVLAHDTLQFGINVTENIEETAKKIGDMLDIRDVKSYPTHSPGEVEVDSNTVLLGELEYIDLYYSHRSDTSESETEVSAMEKLSLFLTGQGIATTADNSKVKQAPIALSIDSEERAWLPDADLQTGAKSIGRFAVERLSKPLTIASGILALDQLTKYAENDKAKDRNGGLSRRKFLKLAGASVSLFVLDRIGNWIETSLPRERTNIKKGEALEEIKKLLPFHDQYIKIRNLVMAQNIHSIEGMKFRANGEYDINMGFLLGGGHSDIDKYIGNKELTESELSKEIQRGLKQVVDGYGNILKLEGDTRKRALEHFTGYVTDWCRLFVPVSVKRNIDSEIDYDTDDIVGKTDNAALMLLKQIEVVMKDNPHQLLLNKVLNAALYELIGPKFEDYQVAYADRANVVVGGARISYLQEPSKEDGSFIVGSDQCEEGYVGVWEVFHRNGHITRFTRLKD
ncbi:hypothetical protein GF389_01680 [Candidatus Dojkabacteria bacterium]|nr:hypothetical protein [Candidatus Dojkabacteria bacterium]